MKNFLRLFPAFLIAVSLSVSAYALNGTSTGNGNRLLESEIILAKKPIIYFIFDLKKKEVYLKSRGLVLNRMQIQDVKFWGEPVDVSPRPMVGKSALFKEPKRVNIDPNKAKEEETSGTNTGITPGAFDVEALELKDMPTSYQLEFQEGVFVSVRPKSAGFATRLYALSSYAGWYVSRPILTIWRSIKGRPFTSIYLTLSEEAARSIYWSLTEKSENILVQP